MRGAKKKKKWVGLSPKVEYKIIILAFLGEVKKSKLSLLFSRLKPRRTTSKVSSKGS